MNIDNSIYLEILKELKNSGKNFLGEGSEVIEEIEDDFSTIFKSVDIQEWEANIDGGVKNVHQLLIELKTANENNDKQKCIEKIAMLRVAVSDIASAFSNAMDSMEKLIVSIRDTKDA